MSQGRFPWPQDLQHLASCPASAKLPPGKQDLINSLRESLRSLRKQCRITSDGALIEDIVSAMVSKLWPSVLRHNAHCTVQWEDISRAHAVTQGSFIAPFDHNLSKLAFICPVLAWSHARNALDLGIDQSSINFEWLTHMTPAEAVDKVSEVHGIPEDLLPQRSKRKFWDIGIPRILPKWKAPGTKWRLIIDKHVAPTNQLKSIVARGVDVLLDNAPP